MLGSYLYLTRTAPRTARGALGGALLLVAFVVAPRVHAHGQFPEAGSIVVDPSDAQRIWVRTTYGVLTTDDGGAGWRWICPESIGYDADKEEPPLAFMGDSAVIIGTFDGLSVSADRCDYAFVGGDLADRYFLDLQVQADLTTAVALSSNGVAADTFEVRLWETSDNAKTWAALGTSPPPDFLALAVSVAPSDPNRIYLSGRDGAAGVYTRAIFRSDDRGGSWQRLDVTGSADSAQALPYLAGVASDDPDKLYVMLIREAAGAVQYSGLTVTTDGGLSWQPSFEVKGPLGGFSASPDGSQIAIGGEEVGLNVADSATLTFQKVNDLRVKCLTWHASGMYACADQFVDDYNVGVSTDGGATFTALSMQSSPCGPPESCGPSTSVGVECPARWPQERAELGAPESCEGAGGAGGNGSGGAGASSNDRSVEGPCGCGVPAQDRGGERAAWLATLGGIALLLSRRRR